MNEWNEWMKRMNEMKWNEMKMNEWMKRINEWMKWNEKKWMNEWHEMKWNEMKWMNEWMNEAGECVGPWRLNRKESSWYMQAAWLWECMRRRLLTHDFIPCHGRSQVSCFQVWFLRRAHNPWRTESCLCPFCIDHWSTTVPLRE